MSWVTMIAGWVAFAWGAFCFSTFFGFAREGKDESKKFAEYTAIGWFAVAALMWMASRP